MLKLRILLKEASNLAVLQNKVQPKNMQEIYQMFEKELQSKKLSPVSVVYLLHQIGFSPNNDDLVQGTHIVLGESVGNPTLERLNADNTKDHGLWQINDRNIKDSKFHKKLKAMKEEEIKQAIKDIIDDKQMRQKAKMARIKQIENNKQKILASLDSGWGIPFISLVDALDPYKSTLYVKFKMEVMRTKKGEDGKWFGWVDDVSQLDAKYGIDKKQLAEQAFQTYWTIFTNSK